MLPSRTMDPFILLEHRFKASKFVKFVNPAFQKKKIKTKKNISNKAWKDYLNYNKQCHQIVKGINLFIN